MGFRNIPPIPENYMELANDHQTGAPKTKLEYILANWKRLVPYRIVVYQPYDHQARSHRRLY